MHAIIAEGAQVVYNSEVKEELLSKLRAHIANNLVCDWGSYPLSVLILYRMHF